MHGRSTTRPSQIHFVKERIPVAEVKMLPGGFYIPTIHSHDWAPPADFKACFGILVAHLGESLYAMYSRPYGWQKYTYEQWRRAFSTLPPTMLGICEWGIVSELRTIQQKPVLGLLFDRKTLAITLQLMNRRSVA